jgi:hypothetical protein
VRFDELSLRIPGDELRMRFHERLTVVAGIGALERQAMVDGLLGTLTGSTRHSTVLTYTDAAGRRVTVTRDQRGDVVSTYEDGSPAPDLVAICGLDDESLRSLCRVQAADVGLLASVAPEAEAPELAEARAALAALTEELEAAVAARNATEALRQELASIDEQLREAEEGRARRRYARLLADLERVRAEAAAIRGGMAGAEADRRFIAAAQEAHRLSERWHRARRRVDECRARFGSRERLDPRTLAEVADVPERVPAELDALAGALREAEARRDRLAARLKQLVTEELPQPSSPHVVRLAGADQDEVWAAARRVVETRRALEQASLDLGGLPAEGTVPALAVELEEAHARLEQAEARAARSRLPGIAGTSLAAIAATVALTAVPAAAAGLLVVAVACALWGIVVPNRRLARARRAEADVLARAGIGSYLGFHVRRIDATIDPTARERLDVAALEHRVALTRWTELAGDIDAVDALALEDEVRAYAEALQSLSGAADEIEATRRELTTVAEPAVERARRALLDACAPYGVDDLELAADLVRHQVEIGITARLQRELEAAEAEEAALAAELNDLLTRLGFEGTDVTVRVGALDRALAAAVERERARAGARPAEVVEAELAELEARARREYQPEWGASVVPDDSAEPDIEALRRRRDEAARAYEVASRVVPDVERLADRRAAVERRVTVLEAALGDSPAAVALADPADIERYLLARITAVRGTGAQREPLPLILDDPFVRIRGERKGELLDLVERLAERAQIVYLSDDPDVQLWARRRVAAGSLLLLEAAPDDAVVPAAVHASAAGAGTD